jgi:hypothetical protein
VAQPYRGFVIRCALDELAFCRLQFGAVQRIKNVRYARRPAQQPVHVGTQPFLSNILNFFGLVSNEPTARTNLPDSD